MTGEEFGRILGEIVNGLENASMDIDETISTLFEIDGKTILLDDEEDPSTIDGPCLTLDELKQLIGGALNGVESAIAQVEEAEELLQSINGNMLEPSESEA